MGKLKICERTGTCSHKAKNMVIAVSVVGLVLMFAAISTLSTPPLSTSLGFTLSFDNGAWDMNTKLWGGEVSSVNKYKTYEIPPGVDTSTLPTEVPGVTGTTLTIDPDRTSKTNLPQGPFKAYSQSQWDTSVPKTNGADPTVKFTISQLWAAMIDGSDAPGGTPVIAKQFDGVDPTGKPCTWYTYYWKASGGIRTDTTWCDQPQIGAGMWVMSEEHNTATCTLYLDISFQSKVTNSSYWWSFGSAKVYDAACGVYPTSQGPPDEKYNGGWGGNWPWSASVDPSAKNSELSIVSGDSSGLNNGGFVLSVGAKLTPGVIYSKDSWGNIDGVVRKVDMQATFTVLYSILVTAPLTLPPNPPQGLEWILDWIANAISDPTSWQFWLLVGAVLVIVILVIPKKKAGMAIYQHFHSGGRKPEPGF